MLRHLFCLLSLALVGVSASQAQSTAPSCPPQAGMPTPEQIKVAQTQAKDRGALWRIQKDGRTSYLFGTIHLGKIEWTFPGQQVRQALVAADSVALELDVSDPATLARLVPPTGTADLVLPAALRQRLDHQIARACLPKGALAAQHPVMQSLSLSGLDARWVGFDMSYGQEFILAGFAKAARKPVHSLETPEIQMKALLPTNNGDALKLIDQTLQDLESGKTRNMMVRMATSWEAGNLDDLASYEQWCDCLKDDDDRAFYRRINDDRNAHLADRIAELHGQSKSVFAAVGVLHMTGPKALPKLMTERGFQVERVSYP